MKKIEKQAWEIIGTEAWKRRQEASRRLGSEARRQAVTDRLVAERRERAARGGR